MKIQFTTRVITYISSMFVLLAMGCSTTPPIVEAARAGQIDNVKALVASGADVNGKDGAEYTALHYAVYYNYINMADFLIAHGANVNAREYTKCTPLLLAANLGHTEIVKTLLTHGADVDSKDQNNWTPLMCATNKGYSEVVKALVLAGANVAYAEPSGQQSAVSLAQRRGQLDVIEALMAKAQPAAAPTQAPGLPPVGPSTSPPTEVSRVGSTNDDLPKGLAPVVRVRDPYAGSPTPAPISTGGATTKPSVGRFDGQE